MADHIRLVSYFYTHCADTPGEAFRLLSVLKEGGVNLLAFSAFPEGMNRCQVDFVPENPDLFLKVAHQAGLTVESFCPCRIHKQFRLDDLQSHLPVQPRFVC